MIGIIDYGMGNVGSLSNMIERLGEPVYIISKPDELELAEKLVLPGVGSFDNGMNQLTLKGFKDPLSYLVIDKKIPILCICLGMQLITKKSEEGLENGLGWIDAECLRFKFPDPQFKVPHMGWNSVLLKRESLLSRYIPENPRFYFVHSFYVKCHEESDVFATSDYGIIFTSMIQRNNIYGTQFHPEKSHKYGLSVIKSFIELC